MNETSSPPRPLPRWWEKALFGVRTAELPRLLPGIGLALAIAFAARSLAGWLGGALLRLQGLDPEGKGSPVSAISVAVILGLLIANTIGVSRTFSPGLDFSVKKVLRLGIILVGIKLSVLDVLKVGSVGVPIVIALVAFALVASLWVARRADVSHRLGSLAAASTAICGITATLAVAPTVEADDKEVAYTVANVTLFGLLGMLVYPYVAHALFGDSSGSIGLFLGTAIHDTSQVMGAAISYKEVFGDERALQIATVTKLTRNAMLVAVVPALAILHARRAGRARDEKRSLAKLFPVFILGFLALSLVRTLGDLGLEGGGLALGFLSHDGWRRVASLLGDDIAVLALGMALASVGLTTRLSVFRGLGPRPFVVGLTAALLVSSASAVLSAWLGPMVGA